MSELEQNANLIREKRENKSGDKGYSLLDFLEMEKVRLKKLQSLFQDKLPEERRLSQEQAFMQKQEVCRAHARKKLLQMMTDENSSFQKQLQLFFDQIFH